jgi:hypothetical protein
MNIAQEVYNALCRHFDIEPTVEVESVGGFPSKLVVHDGEGNSVELNITYSPTDGDDEKIREN